MLSRTAFLVIALHLLAGAARAQDHGPDGARAAAPLTAHRTGQFDAVLPLRSPETEPGRWAARFQFGGNLDRWDYDLATESFSLYVPPDYRPDDEPYGVVVWISPFDDGTIPEEFRELFDERRLIWISPNDSGNARHLFPRVALPLDAALNIERSYNVDPGRIYVSGLSGGGRVATLEAIIYPEVFAGAYPIIGVTTHLQIRLESTPGLFVPFFPRPPEATLERARRHPFVIMTGEGDYNREECRLTYEAHERDGFTNLHYLEIEGMGHEMPPLDEFARGLDLLLD